MMTSRNTPSSLRGTSVASDEAIHSFKNWIATQRQKRAARDDDGEIAGHI